ncbi:unnamed protein product [Cyclocybe aegerita]|uniref:Uncharacterized protein n=1 Tax=Cyclocybe aegerita TaxID=1973307 RepID=A0A8S0WCS0_CYCAE|nr:unnamed protein product [Cyclocybe aegerita]
MPNGKLEEFDEDATFPLQDLSNKSARSDEDRKYTYCMADIDTLCEELGIPWEAEKDIPFQSAVPFIGFLWDLEQGEVSITSGKQEKYLTAITAWEESTKHTLEEVQKLYGKLLHACLVIPAGRAYLTQLEACMGIFHDRPGDASSGWKANNRDIGWAEAVGFFFLVITLRNACHHPGIHYAVYGDNRGVVEGWWKGRSRNWPTNSIFRMVHTFSQENSLTAHTRYVPSKENPADGPSRGEYGTTQDLLPAINIPNHLQHYVVDFDTPHTPTELRLAREGKAALAAPRISPATRLLQRQSTSEGQILHEEEILTSKPATKQHRFSPEHRSTNGGPVRDHTRARASRKPAPYPPDLTPVPSTLRPHVFARERLTRWRPTTVRTATDNQGRPTHLSAEDLARILEVMAGAWADGTLEVYGTGLLTWHAFCDKNGVSEDQRAPASPLLIASLIATLSGAFSGGTIANYVYGIRAWHILHGVPWKMVDPELEALLKAAEKATPPMSKRKKRQPYTKDFMVAIRGQLDLSTPLHAAVYACLTTTFWSAARVGEFTVKNLTSFDANKHVKPSNVTTTTDQNGFETTEFFIPSTKSEPTNGETVSWSRQNGDTDPETAFHNHIDVNSPPNGGHLFAYKVGSGYKPLTKHKFIQILTTAARAAGLEPLQGHGIRIGSTLEYLLRGIPFDVMKAK